MLCLPTGNYRKGVWLIDRRVWSLTYPVRKGKVDSLSKVESLIEASMIGPRKRDDELTSTLISTNNLREEGKILYCMGSCTCIGSLLCNSRFISVIIAIAMNGSVVSTVRGCG